ncbi:hypothetical protein BDBG_16968 [Blastomyces gilchristii SLH14081]|uniref:HPP transmembrane region domain-containing protein n=1 Tax=Blastomyces gilchristii (strain SLH14081) TaxID=559298 RepID=A0A179ULN0_BLAGS|nr:uncharacterized protein BDBG_16968 [Blastomyces gilchristii SLH14081]OAT08129.1 hypothetical protein BDBG_16968 [Blastomyces gilchristii SLH14081]
MHAIRKVCQPQNGSGIGNTDEAGRESRRLRLCLATMATTPLDYLRSSTDRGPNEPNQRALVGGFEAMAGMFQVTGLTRRHPPKLGRLLNRYVPYPRWHLIPRPVAHFLGHRTQPPKKPGNVLVMLWSIVGVFCGLAIVAAVTKNIPRFQAHGSFTMISSFGATAVLEYCSIDSPLAQPRNAFLGQIIASVIGAGIAKLFALHPHAESWFWLGGPVACAVAVAAMIFSKTIHPPAGATALMACIDPGTRRLGWLLIPLVMLSSSLILATALLLNNIQRRFPLYWWTPENLRPAESQRRT